VVAERKQFLLRIDQGLWTDLESWAADELRSVNGQIEYILRDAVRKRKGVSQTSVDAGEADEKGPGNERPTAADSGR
jgi:hypothetical protein